jgi:cellulose synthase/poly-beta-1,6-N-acetylglucosamine synthase-like glycosyltransferase
MLSVLFIASVFLLGITYAGYPWLMAWRARHKSRPIVTGDWEPRVTAVLVVHAGAGTDVRAQLLAKIGNLLALDYPADKLTLRIGCDGRIDTADIPKHDHGARVIVHHCGRRRGKSACLDSLITYCDDEVVLFCDLRQRIAPDALRVLLRTLADPGVGAVGGELRLDEDDARGNGAYRRFESWLRHCEAMSGSTIGLSGALYAARRALLPRIPAGLILDDLWIPLQIARAGARIAYARDAIAWDRPAKAAHEDTRKRRTLAGNYQLLALDPDLRLPWRHPLGWRLLGHKWLRLVAPWLLLVAFVSNLLLSMQGSLYAGLFVAQCVLYALALIALLPVRALPRMLHLPGTFVRLNWCAVLGLADYLRNPRRGHLWQSARVDSLPGGRR